MQQLDVALQNLLAALRLAPNNAQSHINLGKFYYFQGRISEAIPSFEKAIRLDPFTWEAHYYLANSLIRTEMVERAISHYETCLKFNPQFIDAKQNLAMAYVSMRNYEAALPYLQEIAEIYTDHAEIQGHLAECYLDLGKSSEAMQQYQIALQLEPTRAEWQHNLAVLYLRDKQPELAKQHFRLSLKYQPDNQTAKHMLHALEHDSTIAPTAPAAYVTELFDQYAAYYNKHVTDQLRYRVPALLRQAVGKLLDANAKQMNVLDLGCGTGLCGIYFRDLAGFLIGVDLSTQMLAHARSLDAYDGLCCCNILEVIPGYGRPVFDLVLAADVLVYIGDLSPLFKIVKGTIRSNGMFAFTVENSKDEDYILQSSGRYAHSDSYIQQLANKFGFTIKSYDSVQLREQDQIAVSGKLYILGIST